ncbi:hypothetical protein [Bacillus sp. FJAT-49736]|uniref:hypothetical protein n=1 Tax=Bacillus sp. FJAT-49736 TaxID=2833582 RepID=UPI001BC9AA0E|nr:hypothetical protein [Bacillus sp. FJAT-49736]MBS4172397.1 hypothetical protein [Bacillus sp. FJAT-49736]
MRKLIGLAIILVILSGCRQNIPKPETINAKASTANYISQMKQEATIRHFVRGNDLFVECFVPYVSFSGLNKGQPAKIKVYVDGELKGEYNTAAFIMKDLKNGIHYIKVDIVKPNNKSLGLSKKFYITI